MGMLIFYFLVSIFFSFLCSVLEAVLLSITPSYVKGAISKGHAEGHLLEKYKADIDVPLSAILTLNTIAHTAGAIGVGAQAGVLFADSSIDLGIFSLSFESIIAAVMTLAILILSEIIPKTIGANNWQALTPFTIKTLRVMIWVLSPLVWISQLITKTLKKEKSRSVLSRADFAAMVQVGEESGSLDKQEFAIITNLLNFEKASVRDIMTPKPVLFMGEESITLRDFYLAQSFFPYSRIPIYKGNQDHVTGLVLKDELYQNLIEGKGDLTLKEISRPTHFVNDQMSLPELFQFFSNENGHIAIVTDDYGSLLGLVTMEDMLETLLGFEIVDESDTVEDLQKLAKKIWLERSKRPGI